MSSKKVIFILEDNKNLREDLHGGLEDRGFEVESAADMEAARSIMDKRGSDFDVLLLDMEIPGSAVTGAEFGIKVRRQRQADPPEFLIHSAHDDTDFYRLAMDLGAATYLRKAETEFRQVIRHVRILALRRAFSLADKEKNQNIKKIAQSSPTAFQAMETLCQEVFWSDFELTLGAPFFFLLSEGNQTTCIDNSKTFPPQHDSYHLLKKLSLGNTNLSEPLLINRPILEKLFPNPEQERSFQRLQQAVLLPLYSGEAFQLSLGILRQSREENRFAEDNLEVAKLIAGYFRPKAVAQFFKILEMLQEAHIRREEMLKATSRFCLSVSQIQNQIFDNAIDPDSDTPDYGELRKLKILGRELHDTGQMLADLCRTKTSAVADGLPSRGHQSSQNIAMEELIDRVRRELEKGKKIDPAVTRIEVKGHCRIKGIRESLELAISRLLLWLASEPGRKERGPIVVSCDETRRNSCINFEDPSRKIHPSLRKQMFLPFTSPYSGVADDLTDTRLDLGLFTAKMLIEVENEGHLDDISDQVDSGGLRLALSFPKPMTAIGR